MVTITVPCLSFFIFLAIGGALAGYLLIFLVGDETVEDGILNKREQVVICPEHFGSDYMTSFTDDGSVVASLVNTLPPISNYTLPTDESPWFVSLPYNWYWPANYSLVAGSNISWKVKAGSAFTLIFLRGKENYDKFENLDNYEFIAKYPHIEQSQQSFVVNQTDRYFFILKATVSSVSFSTISIHIDHTRYLTEFANFNCSGSCHFQINNSDSSNACLILELPDNHISKTSYYRVAYVGYITSDFAFFLSLAIISSVCLVVFMVLCVVTVRRGKMAVRGTTVLPSSSMAQPAYIVGNQFAQPIDPTNNYQRQGTYAQVPSAPPAEASAPPADAGYGAIL